MASVWKARQVSLDRIVAIKILYSQFSSDPADVERFLSEARMTARLKHPGIVQVYDVGVQDDMYYIVMEYVAGYTVGEWINRSGTLSTPDCLLTAECIANALNYAWEFDQIIHCDVKPDNALIDADGTVKVSDLGLARTLSILGPHEASDEVMGTPFYVSPEQSLGKPDLDCRSDIYSMGAMLYHMSTGTMPFQGYPDADVMDMQVTHTIPDPIDVNPELPAPLSWLIEKMMCKQPDDRQLTWTDVIEDIRHVKNGRRPPIMPTAGSSTVERSRKRIKKKTRVPRHLSTESRKSSPTKYVLVFFLLAAGAFIFGYTQGHISFVLPLITQHDEPDMLADTPTSLELEFQKRVEDIEKQIEDGPGDISKLLLQYEQLQSEFLGTPHANAVRERIQELTNQKETAIAQVMADLETQSQSFIDSNAIGKAADVFADYAGRFADETENARAHASAELRTLEAQRKIASGTEAKQAYEEIMTDVVTRLINHDIVTSRSRLQLALTDPRLESRRTELIRVDLAIQRASQLDDRIIKSFTDHIGRTLLVEFRTGKRKLLIVAVREGRVIAQTVREQDQLGATLEFGLNQLGYVERLRRMGDDSDPGVALAKGLMKLKDGSRTHAKRYFQLTEPELSQRLIDSLKQ